eukprot:6174240-Pleurochrysis_carterae.AAC.3
MSPTGLRVPACEAQAIDYFNKFGGGGVSVGGITVFSAGDANSSGAMYPAFYDGVVAVAGMLADSLLALFGAEAHDACAKYAHPVFAIAATDKYMRKSPSSNYGNWINVSASEVETLTLLSGDSVAAMVAKPPTVPRSRTSSLAGLGLSGTSVACPIVSGLLGLLMSHAPGLPKQEYLNCLYNSSRRSAARAEAKHAQSKVAHHFSTLSHVHSKVSLVISAKTLGLTTAQNARPNAGSSALSASSPRPTPSLPVGLNARPSPSPSSSSVEISILTDDFPDQSTWQIYDTSTGVAVAFGGPLDKKSEWVNESVPLQQGLYNFTIFDSAGDGLCCEHGVGSAQLLSEEGLIAAVENFTQAGSVSFAVPGSRMLQELPLTLLETDPHLLTISVQTDRYPMETTFELRRESGDLITSGGPYVEQESEYVADVTVRDGTYVFTVFDSSADGLCCLYGFGRWRLLLAGTEIASGAASDETSTSVTFSLPLLSPPSPPPADPSPSASPPTSSSTSTAATVAVVVSIFTDDFPDETSWTLLQAGVSVASEESLPRRNDLHTTTVFVEDAPFEFYIYDDFGDGICCSNGPGWWTPPCFQRARFHRSNLLPLFVKLLLRASTAAPYTSLTCITPKWFSTTLSRQHPFHVLQGCKTKSQTVNSVSIFACETRRSSPYGMQCT